MIRLTCLALSLVFLPVSVAYPMTGNELLERCEKGGKGNSINLGHCTGYIHGVIDSFREIYPDTICVPKTATWQQIVDVITLRLREAPGIRHQPAAVSTWLDLSMVFPCK